MEIWGWGKKNTADVNSKGELLTLAEASAPDHRAAEDNDTFTLDIDGIQTDGASYWLAVIKNGHSTKDLIVTSITGWVPSFSNTQIYEAVIGQTFVYASNGTEIVPVNVKSGISGGALGNFYVNDGSGDITTIGGTGLIVGRYIFGTEPGKWTKRSGWHIPPNQTFMIRSDLAEKLTGYVSFYYETK